MTKSSDQRFYWLALRTVTGIGAVRCNALVKRFGSAKSVLEASERELQQLPDVGEKLTRALKSGVDYQAAEKQLKMLEDSGADLLTILDDDYPESLKQIYDPPPMLFVKGTFADQDELSVAMVGSRVCTRYGRQISEKMAIGLASRGLTVVSGLARGIDSAAHRGAIRAGGRTIGVLGCGLDIVYPPENETLYEQVAAGGALVSEFFFGAKPEKHNFPSRNRVISGLSQGVLLIEAGRSSGALLTAKHALDQNREVLAVPGNVNSQASFGTNELLKQGAAPVTSVDDVLLALGLDPRAKRARKVTRQVQVPEAERRVFEALGNKPKQIDKISENLNQPVEQVLRLLLNLEMAGLVKQLSGKQFVREN